MKILKIIICLSLGIGSLVGILFLAKSCTGTPPPPPPPPDSTEYTLLNEEINNAWKGISKWNLGLYNEEMKKANDKYSTLLISQNELQDLIGNIRSKALVAINKTLPKLMKASVWESTKIDAEMAGIDSVAQSPELANKEEVVCPKAVNKLYYEVIDWVENTNNVNIWTYYNGSATNWRDFNDIVNETENKVFSFKKTKYYEEFLANKLDNKLAEAVNHVKNLRDSYYVAIAESIKHEYPIENWDNYSDPLAAFQKVYERLIRASNKLKAENRSAGLDLDDYKAKFNKSRPQKIQ